MRKLLLKCNNETICSLVNFRGVPELAVLLNMTHGIRLKLSFLDPFALKVHFRALCI